ncbi:MAG TPA: YihY/virulence factor BrkB family protein [Usitatibacter sp.]|nr:YihY/virulence factor BrkB family protein [Usitatibacter sp.]
MRMPAFVPVGTVLRRALKRWSDDDASSMGAALAFYALFSMAPLLLLVISLVSMVVDARSAHDAVVGSLAGLLGERGASAVQALLVAADEHGGRGLSAVVSIATLILGATSVLAQLRKNLDAIWQVPPRPQRMWWSVLGPRLAAFGLVLAIGFLLLVSLVSSAAVSALGSLWASYFPGAGLLLRVLEMALSIALAASLFALVYKILPSARIAWRDVWFGAIATSLLFWIGKWLIGLYIAKSAIASPFGAAGTLVAVMVWVYYSAQVFFLGAEVTRAYSEVRATPRQP